MVELSAGKHMINVGIGYDEMPESSRVYSADTWAWESDKAIEIGENALLISIKRKWHLFRPVTVEAEIMETFSASMATDNLDAYRQGYEYAAEIAAEQV